MRQHPTGRKTCRSECRLHSSVDEVHGASPAAAGQLRKGGTGLVRWPRTESCGTPNSTANDIDRDAAVRTYCVRPVSE